MNNTPHGERTPQEGRAQGAYRRITESILARPRTAVLLLVGLSVGASLGAVRIEIDDDIESLMPDDIPSRILQNEIREIFGTRNEVFIAVRARDGSIFNPVDLEAIRGLALRLEALETVDEVLALSKMTGISGGDGLIEVVPVAPDPIETPAAAAALRERILSDPLLRPNFLSDDETFGALVVSPVDDADPNDLMAQIYATLPDFFPEERIFLTGDPVFDAQASEYVARDLLLLTPGVALVLALILFVALRTAKGVAVTLIVIGLSVGATVGLMGLFGIPFRAVSSAIPIFVLSTACADSIHLLTRFHVQREQGEAAAEAVRSTMASLSSPVTLTSLTTTAGFCSLVGSPMPALTPFGLFIGVGVMWAWGLSLFLMPALLVLLDPVRRPRPAGTGQSSFLDRPLVLVARLATRRPGWIFAGTVVLVLLCGLAITRVEVESSPESFYPEDSRVIRGMRVVDQHFGGSRDLSILVEGEIESPAVLQRMVALQADIDQIAEVGTSTSVASVVQRLNQVLHDDDPAEHRIPDRRDLVAQELLLYSMSDGDLEELADPAMTAALILCRVHSLTTREDTVLLQQIREKIARHSEGVFEADVTGAGVFIAELAGLIVRSALMSLAAAILMVFLISLAAIRSARLSLLSVVPLTVAVVLNFGLMGLFGVTLNIATALITCIVIGVGIDYAVHTVARFRDLAVDRSRTEAAQEAVRTVGRPILINALAVALGFSVLLVSGFTPIKYLGALAVLAMFSTSVGALTLLPALLGLGGSRDGDVAGG